MTIGVPAHNTSIPVVCPLHSGVSRHTSASCPLRTCSSWITQIQYQFNVNNTVVPKVHKLLVVFRDFNNFTDANSCCLHKFMLCKSLITSEIQLFFINLRSNLPWEQHEKILFFQDLVLSELQSLEYWVHQQLEISKATEHYLAQPWECWPTSPKSLDQSCIAGWNCSTQQHLLAICTAHVW